MDIYSSALEQGLMIVQTTDAVTDELLPAPALVEIEVRQMDKELEEGNVGLTTWVVTGIEIQQEKVRLNAAKQKYQSPTSKQEVELARMKEKIVQKTDKLMSSAEQLC